MARNLQKAFEWADDIIESVQQQPPPPRLTSTREKSLHEKLYDIYVEECEREAEAGGPQSNANLLEKLLRREALPCLVVNLYSENQGYSLMLKDKSGSFSETFQLPYDVKKLLEYLDAEELPSFLIDVLDKSPVNVFHHGCVIAEIRDYRQCSNVHPPGELGAEPAVSSDVSSAWSSAASSAVSFAVPSTTSPPAYQTRHILLRPTMQSLVSDVESITSDNRQWTEEERLELERQLILATAEPLCLDPSVAVTCTANRLLFNEQKMNTDPVKQCFKRPTIPSLDQQEVSSGCTCPPDLTTMTPSKKAKIGPDDPDELLLTDTDAWMQGPCELTMPSELDVQTYINKVPSLLFDDEEPSVLEVPEVKHGFMFDYEDDNQLWEMNPNIMKSLNDPFFSADIGPLPEDRIDSHMYFPHMSLDDYADDFVARVDSEPREIVDICQGSAQGEAKCSSKVTQGFSSSVCLPQPFLETKPIVSVVPKPTPSLVSKPTTSLVAKPTISVVPKPTISVVPKSTTSVVPKPTTSLAAKPKISVVAKPTTSLVAKPATSLVAKPATSLVAKPATSLVAKPATSLVAKPATSLVAKPATGLVPTSVLEQESRILPPLALTQISKLGSSTVSCGQNAPPAPKTSTVVQQATVGMSRVNVLPLALQPTARSSENKPKVQGLTSITTTDVINVVKSKAKPSLVGNSTQILGRPTSVPAAAGITQNSLLPTRQQPPRPAQRPVKSPMQIIINNTANPLTVKLPPGSVILRPGPQKSSQGQPQQIYVLIPKQQQTPKAPAPPQPVPPASSQGPNNNQQLLLPAQQTSRLSTEQTGLLNTGGARGVQLTPTPTSVVSQVGSTQKSHRQSTHLQSLEHPATLVQQRQTQSQNVQVRIIPHIVTVGKPGTQCSDRGHAAGEPSDRTGGPPNTPKP